MRFLTVLGVAALSTAVSGTLHSLNPPESVLKLSADKASIELRSLADRHHNLHREHHERGHHGHRRKRERHHQGGKKHHGHHGGHHCVAKNQTLTGTLRVTDIATRKSLGYMSPIWNAFGEYSPLVNTTAAALVVEFTAPYDCSTKAYDYKSLNLLATNAPSPSFPLFAGIVGYFSSNNDLGRGSANYVFVGGAMAAVPAASPPFLGGNTFSAATGIDVAIETAIWAYNPKTGAITATWTNTDNTPVPAQILYIESAPTAFALVGDVSTFTSTYGPNNHVTLTFVPSK